MAAMVMEARPFLFGRSHDLYGSGEEDMCVHMYMCICCVCCVCVCARILACMQCVSLSLK